MTCKRATTFVFGVVAVAVLGCGVPACELTPPEQIELRLYRALSGGERPGRPPASLILLLGRRNARWEPVYGVARDFSEDVHSGWVNSAALTDSTFALSLTMGIRTGHEQLPATFEVELTSVSGGCYRGRYEGRFDQRPVRGVAEAFLLPEHRRPLQGFRPVEPGEHPRILFRRAQREALRKKAATPFGRAALSAMDGPVGLALRYQLLGDPSYARSVIPLVEKMMARGLLSDQYGNNVGDRLEKTAIAYDCCYDVWPPQFRRRVERYMLWAAERILAADRTAHHAINWNICSNWAAPLYAGAGFAGLALFGEKGPAPNPPPDTEAGSKIEPARNYKPPAGVPVCKLQSDVMPEDWIYVGGFQLLKEDGDPLAAVGGRRAARLVPGQRITYGEQTETVRPLSHQNDRGYWRHERYAGGNLLIDITNAVGRRYFTHNYFFVVLRNSKSRWVRVATDPGHAVVYLNGVRLKHGECAHLSEGLYPMLVEAPIGWMNPWGRHLMRPRLVEVGASEAAQIAARSRALAAFQKEVWKRRLQWWRASGGASVEYQDLLGRTRFMMYLACREAVGCGGFTAELAHYGGIAEKPLARYVPAHCNVFGYDPSPLGEMADILPRKMFVHVYPSQGEPKAQEINSTPHAPPELFAALFPSVRPQWKPAVLWGWYRHAGATGDDPAALLKGDPVRTFLHYPMSMKPRPPAGILPLTWQAATFGFYGFRNTWSGPDDFIVQVFLKAHPIGGWNAPNAGTLRVWGLGHVWADGPVDRNRHRWEESVVMLPENPEINARACGRLAYLHCEQDGSGIVSIDLNDVYATSRRGPNGRRARLYERYGGIRREESFLESGIRGMRSIGVDYSGLSGAVCLLALVDRIQGGGRKVWVWQLYRPGKKRKGKEEISDAQRAVTEGNRFEVRKPDGATLCGTFVTGQRPVAEVRQTTMIGRAGSSAGKVLARPIHGIFAESTKGVFFVVLTIQRGEAPKVTIKGRGLDAVVTVGRRVVRFDGRSIVFEEVSR